MTLSIKNLTFERNYHSLFENLHFTLQKGEALQIVGVNGSGKSTLLRILAGLLTPTEGDIFWENQLISHDLTHYQQQLNYVGHQNGVKFYLTVKENIAFFSTLRSLQTIHDSFLKTFHLENTLNKLASHLSAGQQRKLALTRLILNPTPIWILDEPTTALDQEGQEIFFNLLEKHLTQGGIAILTSHHALPQNISTQKIILGEKSHA